MERKGTSLFTNSASMRELKNRNSLAMLNLRKEIQQFEEHQKFVVKHLAQDRVSQYEFLKEIRVCETNLNPRYHRLLQGKLSNDDVPNSLRKSRKTVQTAPPGYRTGRPGLSAAGTALVIAPRTATTALPHRVKSQMELSRHQHQKTPPNHDQAEEFMKQLREKNLEDELILQELSEANIEAILLKRIQSGLSRVPFPKPACNLPCDRWAGPREPGFYTFNKPGSTPGQHSRFADSLPTERWLGQADSAFYSFSKGDNAPSVTLPKDVCVPRLEINSDVGMGRKEQFFELDALSTMGSGSKRTFKRKPVELRIHEFLEKLEVVKQVQEKKLQNMPFWEKRRQWMALTRGVGTTFAQGEGGGNH